LTYFFLKSISIFFLCFPRNLSIKIAGKLGSLIYYIYPKRKQVAILNLNIAFPNKTKQEIKELIKKTYQHYTILMVEFFRQKNIDFNKIDIDIDEKTQQILSRKEGLIVMTAHMGNWEFFIPIVSKYKKASAIVKVQKNLGGDKFFSKNRQFDNITLISMKSPTRNMINTLLNGDFLLLASDQNARSRGTKISFFGKETSVAKGAGYFHYKTNCPIAIGFCILKKDNSYSFKLRIIDIETERIKENINNLCTEVNTKYSALLEEEIKKNPEQYFWFHKKWSRNIYG